MNCTSQRLHVDALTAGFPRRPVLRNLSLSADVGEVIAINGENGSGKTTLARPLAGLHPICDNAPITVRLLRSRLTREGVMVLIADSKEGRFYRLLESIDKLLTPRSVKLFGDQIYGEMFAEALGRHVQVSRFTQKLVFRSIADVVLTCAFVRRYDLSCLTSHICQIGCMFESMFGRLPTVISWPEICVTQSADS